jgi:phage-related protein
MWHMLRAVSPHDKPLIWLRGQIRTPPFSAKARLEVGYYLRLLQRGDVLSMPVSRPMPSIGARCHELRIKDAHHTWRVIYRAEVDRVLVIEVFDKNQNKTPKSIIESCKRTLNSYDRFRKESSQNESR